MTITTIDGSAGGTILDQSGAVFIQLGAAASTVMASLGADTIFGDEGTALIDATGNPNTVQVQPGLGTETIIGGTGDLTIVGTDGWESVTFSGLPGHMYIVTNTPGTLATTISDGTGTDSVLGGSLVYEWPGTTWPQPFTISVAALDATKTEGNSGSTEFAFTLTRGGDSTEAVSVNWAVIGSGANPADTTDFSGGVLPSGTVNFGAGQTAATITVYVAGDSVVEPDNEFTVTLSNPSAGGTLGTTSATGTIRNDDATTLSVAQTDALKTEGNSGSTAFIFTVTRGGDASAAGSVDWAVTGSDANPADATDFSGGVLPSGTVNFAAGQTSATITINVAGDATVEPDNGFTVTLSNPTAGATLGTASVDGLILNDDSLTTTLSVVATDTLKTEANTGSTAFTFTVIRAGDATTSGSVNWAVTGSAANPANAADFAGGVLPSGTVNFTAGQTTATITVNVAGDTTVEPDNGFTVTLSNPSGGATLSTASATGTILNDDSATLSVAALDAVKAEGNSGFTAFTFTVTRAGNALAAGSVNWAVTGSGANPAAAADFSGDVLPSGTLNFVAGQTSATITVNIAGDTAMEPDNGFTVTLSNPTAGATIGTTNATGTILNDDTPMLSVAALDAVKAEGNSGSTPFTFTVTRAGDAAAAGSVDWIVTGNGDFPADATAFSGNALPSGTVNFIAGQTSATITVNVAGDTTVEPDNGFAVTLSNPTAGAVLGTASATGIIVDDDAATITLSVVATDAVKAEGNGGSTPFTFTVTRGGNTIAAGSVDWAVTGSGANAADFSGGVLPSGTVNFAAGQTTANITVNVAGEKLVEPDNDFTVTLSNPSADAIFSNASATGTILNDDISLSIAPTDAAKAEGNSGSTLFTFTVTRAGDTIAAGSVNWAVTGNGTNAADFSGGALPAGTVNFAAGQTSALITVEISGDTVAEPDEAFAVTLSNPSGGASFGAISATGTILTDDDSFAIVATNAVKAEGNIGATAFTFTVTRTGDPESSASVDWAVTGSGATPADGADFTGGALPSGKLTFAGGQTSATITVNVTGDSAMEPDNGFTVTLSNPTGGAALATASATGTIQNDDIIVIVPGAPPDPLAAAIHSPFYAALSTTLTSLIGGAWGTSWTNILPFAPGITPPPAPPGFVNALSVPGGAAGAIAIPAAAKLAFNTATAPVTLTGAVSGDFIVNAGGDITTTVTSGVFVDAQQNANQAGNEAITALAGSLVFTGAGNDTIRATSGNNSLEGGTGRNLFVLGAGLNLVLSEGQDTIQTGKGNATVTGADTTPAAPDILIQGNKATLSFLNGAGQATVIGGKGAVTADGGAGGGSFRGGTAGNNLLITGAQATTLLGGGNGDRLIASNTADNVLTAASRGSTTLDGSAGSGNNLFTGGHSTVILTGAGDDTVAGGPGKATIHGSAGNDVIGAATKGGIIVAGSGNDTITAGNGTDVITFVNGQAGGADLIAGFNITKDHIMLQGYGAGAITDALATTQAVTGGVSFSLTDGTMVTVTGVTLLAASNFQLS